MVLDQEGVEQHASCWSPDGDWIAYQRVNAGNNELVKIPLGGGKPVVLGESTRGADFIDWSPDGKWICHPFRGHPRLVSADGQQQQQVLNSPGTAALGFSSDSSTLYAVRRNAAHRWELAVFSIPDGREQKVTPLDLPLSAKVSGFSLHPGRKSFATSVGTSRQDIWLLDGFHQPSPWSLRRWLQPSS